jgi:hypothetical protein
MHRPDPSTFCMYVICLVSLVQGRAMNPIVVLAGPANSRRSAYTERLCGVRKHNLGEKMSRLRWCGLLPCGYWPIGNITIRLGASQHRTCNSVVTAVTFATYVIIAILSMCFCLFELMMELGGGIGLCLNVTLAMLCGSYIVNFLLCYPNVFKFCKGHAKILQYLCLLTFHWLIITLTTLFLIK